MDRRQYEKTGCYVRAILAMCKIDVTDDLIDFLIKKGDITPLFFVNNAALLVQDAFSFIGRKVKCTVTITNDLNVASKCGKVIAKYASGENTHFIYDVRNTPEDYIRCNYRGMSFHSFRCFDIVFII